MKRKRSLATRKRERLDRARRLGERILRGQSLRPQMFGILVLTGGVGFLVSWALLHLGLTALWLRYPVAVAAGYCAFLLLLRLWLSYQQRRRREHRDGLDDIPDPSILDVGEAVGRGGRAARDLVGGGGRFGGAGASGTFPGPVEAPVPVPLAQARPEAPALATGGHGSGVGSRAGDSSGLGDLLGLGGADENTIPLVVIAALLATALSLVLAAVYLVWTAPALLAEILVDSLVVAALSHRLRRIDSPLWIGTVLRRTWFPAAGVALALGLTGYLLQRWNPAIDSIGDVLRMFGRG